jgi:4-hydroxybenzoate polyprenyltransferase
MKVLRNILDFYINASIHVALAVYAFVRITEISFNLSYNDHLDYFIFYGTITGYNFVKYAGVAKLHHKSLTNDLKIIQVFSFFCFAAMCFYGYLIDFKTLLFCVPFTLLTVMYAVPFLSGFHKNLRQISYLKIMVVAVVWAGFTVIVPVFDAEKPFSFTVALQVIQRFLLVVILILPFDIRDVKFDAISLQTIPKKIGVKNTKRLGVALLVFSLVLEFLSSTEVATKTPFMLFFFLMMLFLMRAETNQSKYYSSFWVEALPIIWWLVLLGFHNF